MADTVVTLGGDSSGLQDAFKDAGKKAEELKAESKKLTDQLREVADEADKAAGAFVQGIGGPGAIKAIAGVGAAVGLAKAGVEAFLDSSEALFRSYGDQGQKVWDDTEKSLFAIKGAFAEAVLGGGSLEEMGRRLKAIFEGVKGALDFLLSPLAEVSKLFWGISTAADGAATSASEYGAAMTSASTAYDTAVIGLNSYNEALGYVITSEGELKKLQIEKNLRLFNEAELALRAGAAARGKAYGDVAAAEAKAEFEATADFMAYATDEQRQQVAFGAVGLKERLKAQMMGDARYLEALKATTDAARAQAEEAAGALLPIEKEQLDRVLTQRANYEQLLAEQSLPPIKPAAESTAGAGGATKPAAADDLTVYVMEAENGLAVLTEAQGKAYQEAERMMGDSTSRLIEMKQSELAQIEQFRQDNATAEIAIETDKIARIEKEREDAVAREKATAEAERAAKKAADEAEAQRQIDLAKRVADEKAAAQAKMLGDVYTLVVNNSAKMLAVDLQDAEKSKTAAQRATAAVISGLGDMAMVKSGLAAAAGNFAEAAAYSVAGTFAYGLAAKLAPTEKSKTTPPAAATNAPSSTSVSYNLRVDAAFADGESVARRFAEMQRGAQRRGLV